jgi:hypothetical protein
MVFRRRVSESLVTVQILRRGDGGRDRQELGIVA